jgi:dTDP-glucose 4,6-dehydratase
MKFYEIQRNDKQNIEIVKSICREPGKPESLITYVTDRKGHDMRYAIDPAKIHRELGWLPETKFEDGRKKTIKWYLDNRKWWEDIISGEYQSYYEKMYGDR